MSNEQTTQESVKNRKVHPERMNRQGWHELFKVGEECLKTVEIVTQGKVVKLWELCSLRGSSRRQRKDGEKDCYISKQIADTQGDRGEQKDKEHLSFFAVYCNKMWWVRVSSSAGGSCDSFKIHSSKTSMTHTCVRLLKTDTCTNMWQALWSTQASTSVWNLPNANALHTPSFSWGAPF